MTTHTHRRILAPSDNNITNIHTPVHLHKTDQSLTVTLPLQYPNLNIIVLDDLQYNVSSTTLHRIGYQLLPPPNDILPLLTQAPLSYNQPFPLIIPKHPTTHVTVTRVKAKQVFITFLPTNHSFPKGNNATSTRLSHPNYFHPTIPSSTLISFLGARPHPASPPLKPQFISKKWHKSHYASPTTIKTA